MRRSTIMSGDVIGAGADTRGGDNGGNRLPSFNKKSIKFDFVMNISFLEFGPSK
jgi:hypothetical protein